MKKVFVKILKFQGLSGGYAIEKTTRYTVFLVNGGKTLKLDDSELGHRGHCNLHDAETAASRYADLLDVPVRHFFAEEKTKVTQIEKEFKIPVAK